MEANHVFHKFLGSRAQSLLLFLLRQHRMTQALENLPRCEWTRVQSSATKLFAVFRPFAQIKGRPERFSGQEKHPHGMVRVLHC